MDAALHLHIALGPGLLESAYQACLAHELRRRGLSVVTDLILPVTYCGIQVDKGYRLDLLVQERVVVELKAIAKVLPVHEAQLLSYLKLGGYPIGLLVNFHVKYLKHGITRLINDPR